MMQGGTATDALIYDLFHMKTRFRRAKAEFAIAKQEKKVEKRLPYLVQARQDLKEALDPGNDDTSATAIEACKKMLLEVSKELHQTKVTFLNEKENRSHADWDYQVLVYRSLCH